MSVSQSYVEHPSDVSRTRVDDDDRNYRGGDVRRALPTGVGRKWSTGKGSFYRYREWSREVDTGKSRDPIKSRFWRDRIPQTWVELLDSYLLPRSFTEAKSHPNILGVEEGPGGDSRRFVP